MVSVLKGNWKKKSVELNENKNVQRAVPKGKFKSVDVYIRKRERSQVNLSSKKLREDNINLSRMEKLIKRRIE